jgi:carbon storage regulator
MMMMRRREGEKILIGDNITIHITRIGRGRVHVGIEAPRDIAVVAEEIQRVRNENAAAAAASPEGVLAVLNKLQPCAPAP